MKKFILAPILFAACIAGAEVFIMPMDEPEQTVKQPAAVSDIKPDTDDEMLGERRINELMRYTICGTFVTDITEKNKKPQEVLDAEAETGQIQPDKYTIIDHKRRLLCGTYYAGADAVGKGLAVNAALRDLYGVESLEIKSTVPVRTNRNDFNIAKKTPVAVKSFNRPGIYKKVLTSKNKIRNLYNYADLPLAWQINSLMDSRGSSDLPVRINIYEDSSAKAEKGMAVIVFGDGEKYLIPLRDIHEVSGDVYDIKPDFSYKYK